jgi:simple sugar transport system ATP-binding protein
MEGIGKQFPLVTALAEVSLCVSAGEVHALLGENGAGKSTLMNLLCGLLKPDRGQILLDGRPVTIGSPKQAADLGIGMVHQHLSLVGTLTAAENVLLPRLPFVVSQKRLLAEFEQLRNRFGMTVDGRAIVAELPLPQQQQVELLRALASEPKLLILDEPTAVLTASEAARLSQSLRQHVGGGGAVIYISHKLDQVLAVADRVTVLRRGRVVGAGLSTENLRPEQLAALMIGEPLESPPVRSAECTTAPEADSQPTPPAALPVPAEEVLRIDSLHVDSDRGQSVIRGLSLRISAGEIFGIAGMGGSGQHELCEALLGTRPVVSGTLHCGGAEITHLSTAERRKLGLGMVPEDRLLDGVASHLSVAENFALNVNHRPTGWLGSAAFLPFARRLMKLMGFQEATLSEPIWTLSGGNIQKVILARELSTPKLRLLIASYPCRGLDVGAMQTVHRLLRECARRGAAVLLLSEEIDELLSLTDRLAVLVNGTLHGEAASATADRAAIGLLLGGVVGGVVGVAPSDSSAQESA